MIDRVNLDYETFSQSPFGGAGSHGLWKYMNHPSTEPLFLGYKINGGQTKLLDFTAGDTLPPELAEALADPDVEKWAFNAAFERLATRRLLKIKTPIKGWRCTMALAYMRAFSGSLDKVGEQMNIPSKFRKDIFGNEGINLFSRPQKVTKSNLHERRTRLTDPDKWDKFGKYCIKDVDSEDYILQHLYPEDVDPAEWEVYEHDQEINDEGFPVNMRFVRAAHSLFEKRKLELREQMNLITKLENSNSGTQLLPWLRERGYSMNDLQKDTIVKQLNTNVGNMTGDAIEVLRLRQLASRTSPTKYAALMRLVDDGEDGDSRLHHSIQYGGASRTLRFAGRSFNVQNLPSTPKSYDAEDRGAEQILPVVRAIEAEDEDAVIAAMEMVRDSKGNGITPEPMLAYSTLLRSSFGPVYDHEQFTVADLASVETAGTAWFTRCKRLLKVFADGRDPYKDYGQEFFKTTYEALTKDQRQKSKPAVLGGTYGLGGGSLILTGKMAGKKSGLWGYAENMGVNLTQAEANMSIQIFRETYFEIPEMWTLLDRGVAYTIRTGRVFEVNDLCRIQMKDDYLQIVLPSGRPLWYHLPKMVPRKLMGKNKETGEPQAYEKLSFSYMGRVQNTQSWARIFSWGGKIIENIIQALCRDVLVRGQQELRREGFRLVAHCHDENIALTRIGANYHTVERMIECMTTRVMENNRWLEGFPLGAAGWQGPIYMKA